jgi:protein-S-isoprenylcysteine O-methyltransferase Ste14
MLQILALVELLVCWIAWTMAFVKPRQKAVKEKQVVRAPESRWGIALVTVGFALVWVYVRPTGFQKSAGELIASMVLGPPSVALAWAAARRLGKQWRYEAALTEDHELVQAGPYRWVRHPIYASMLGMLTATGAAWTWWPMWIAGTVVFLAGTEIRVRAEDRLLEERFQDRFQAYRERVPAYFPFLR